MAGARVALPVAGNPASSSLIDFELADGAGAGTPESILGFSVAETGGTASVTVTFHDGTSASGPILHPPFVLTGETADVMFPTGLQVQSGSVYAAVSGTGTAQVVVYW